MSSDARLALAEAFIECGMLPVVRRDRCANCSRFGVASITGGKPNYRCAVGGLWFPDPGAWCPEHRRARDE